MFTRASSHWSSNYFFPQVSLIFHFFCPTGPQNMKILTPPPSTKMKKKIPPLLIMNTSFTLPSTQQSANGEDTFTNHRCSLSPLKMMTCYGFNIPNNFIISRVKFNVEGPTTIGVCNISQLQHIKPSLENEYIS